MKSFLSFLILLIVAQTKGNSLYKDSTYENAFAFIQSMLDSSNDLSFKEAVFVVENAYFANKASYVAFDTSIKYLTNLARAWQKNNRLIAYNYKDSLNLNNNIAIFKVIRDTVKISLSRNQLIEILPYSYNYDDFFGNKQWENMFVMTLIATHKGNCHSLPYLYKILADELGTTCWLSFAPYHIYIKNRCEGLGWYNTELTSGQFPIDAWVMASGYVSTDAIRSGIYMDTLSNRQAIANCALDLAKGYERKYKIYTDSFIVRCCDLTLKHHPNNINAIIYKAEVLRKMYFIYEKGNPALAAAIYSDMEKLYLQAMDWGYKEMPEKMYREWLESVTKQKNKYSNKRASTTIGNKKTN